MSVLALALKTLDPSQAWELDALVPLGEVSPGNELGERGATAILSPRLDGLPVDLPAHVTFGPDGSVRRVVSSPLPSRKIEGELLPWAQIRAIAEREAEGADPRGRLSWQEVTMGTLRRVWTVDVEAWEGGSRRITLDAVTGAVLGMERTGDRVDYAPPGGISARAFVHNPALEEVPLKVRLLTTSALADERVLVLQCSDEGELREGAELDGEPLPLHVCTRRAVLAEGRDWLAEPVLWPEDPARDEDAFVAPHAYWNALRGLDWFEALGWTPMSSIVDSRLHVVVNYRGTDLWDLSTASDPAGRLLPYDNAYFTGGYTDSEERWVPLQLVLGQGSVVDLGYDADVLHHELSHAIVHTRGGPRGSMLTDYGPSLRASALNEGFADYFSSAIHGDPVLAEFVALGFDRESIRDLGARATCMEDLTGEPHDDSLVISQPLWRLRTELAAEQRPVLDQVVLDGLSEMGGRADFAMATEVLLAGVRSRLGEASTFRLAELFAERGLPHCPPIRPLAPPQGDEEYSLSFTDLPSAGAATLGEIPGYLQLRVDIPEGGARVRLDFQQRYWLGLDLGLDDTPQRLSAVGRSGERLTWTRHPVQTEDGEEKEDWRSDGAFLGTSVLLGTRPDPDDPQYLLYDERLEWEVAHGGPFVFQLVHEERRLATARHLVLTVLPAGASEEPGGCGCASARGAGMAWLAALLMGRRSRRQGSA